VIKIRTFADWEVRFLSAAEIERREKEFAQKVADLKRLVLELEEVLKAARLDASRRRGLPVLG